MTVDGKPDTTKAGFSAPLPSGDLEHLIQVERHLEAMLQEARAEARRVVEQARLTAETAEKAVQAELDEATSELQEQVGAQKERQLAEIVQQYEVQARSFDEVGEPKLEDLAAFVLRAVIGSAG